MLIEEKFVVNVPIKQLFEFLLDPEKIQPCIPGCEMVEQVGDKEYDSVIKAKVGMIKVKFKIRSIIEETVPYSLIRTAGQGNELAKLGHFKQKTEINLKELSENETEISYRSDVSIVGKLATFGDRILKAKAKDLGKEFAGAVKMKLEPKKPEAELETISMSYREKIDLNRKRKRVVFYLAALCAVLGILLVIIYPIFPVMGAFSVCVLFLALILVFFHTKCPKCGGSIGNAIIRPPDRWFSISKKIKYCPLCGVHFDSEMDNKE
jgi:carbon monoxide dehydrogenase subunit G